ncbi:hypothetical protein KAW38_05185 [Candidatus Micrarchaeota archaeon]|nr:hypothetical protein [Candidatus Micrarchaeota archaeon]
MKVLAAGWHTGSVNSIAPVVRELVNKKVKVFTVAYGVGAKAFANHKIKPDLILDKIELSNIRKIIQKIMPTSILTGLAVPDKSEPLCLEQEMVREGKNLGIFTLSVLDFWGNYLERVSKLDVTTQPVRITVPFRYIPDKIACLDELSMREMTSLGFPKSSLLLTGNPHFAEIIRKKPSVREEKMRILYCSQPIEHHYGDSLGYTEKSIFRELFKTLYMLSEKLGKIIIDIRLHPREKQPFFETGVFGNIEIRDDNDDLHTALARAQVIASIVSTVLVEARLLGKPAISIEIGKKEEAQNFLKTNSLNITSSALTTHMLYTLLDDAFRNKLKQNEISFPSNPTEFILSNLK